VAISRGLGLQLHSSSGALKAFGGPEWQMGEVASVDKKTRSWGLYSRLSWFQRQASFLAVRFPAMRRWRPR